MGGRTSQIEGDYTFVQIHYFSIIGGRTSQIEGDYT
jgi:hypothetical protein